MTAPLLIVRVTSSESELVCDWLWGAGAIAIEHRQIGDSGRSDETADIELAAGFNTETDAVAAQNSISRRWPARLISTGDTTLWRDRWLDYIEPTIAGPLLIKAPWHSAQMCHEAVGALDGAEPSRSGPVQHEISIDPGTCFGSGHHPTTQLSIRALAREVNPGDRLLDVGSGSGILSISAALFGAQECIGFDIDQDSNAIASTNARHNNVDGICQFVITDGTITKAHPSTATGTAYFDIVVANIVTGDLTDLISQLAPQSRRTIILSGFLNTQRQRVEAELSKHFDSSRLDWTQEQQWSCLTATIA